MNLTHGYKIYTKSIFKCESHNVKYVCNSLYIIKLMVIQIYIKEFKFITFKKNKGHASQETYMSVTAILLS